MVESCGNQSYKERERWLLLVVVEVVNGKENGFCKELVTEISTT